MKLISAVITDGERSYKKMRGRCANVDCIIVVLTDTDTCGNQSFSNLTGMITSPHFPSVYPHGLNCMYYFDVGIYNSLSLEFRSFHLESSHSSYVYSSGILTNCRYDWVEVNKCLISKMSVVNHCINILI